MFCNCNWIALILSLLVAQHLRCSAGYGSSEQLWLEVLRPADVSYSYKIRPARDFGSIVSRPFYHIKLVLTDPSEGCSHIFNGDRLRGQVAFIRRGGCSFVTKSLNAELYGAVAVLIFDNHPDNNTSWIDMIGDGTNRDNQVGIPAFFMLGKDGRMITDSMYRHKRKSAIVNLPLNYTHASTIRQPPWNFW